MTGATRNRICVDPGAMHTSIGIVDGQPEDLGPLTTAFLAAGYDVDGGTSFADAMNMLDARPRAVLVVTVELGAYNGLHVMLRCLARHPKTRVVVVGPDSAALRNEALTLGASVYAARPVTPETLVSRVNDLLGQRRRPQPVLSHGSRARTRATTDGPAWPSLATHHSAGESVRGVIFRHGFDIKR